MKISGKFLNLVKFQENLNDTPILERWVLGSLIVQHLALRGPGEERRLPKRNQSHTSDNSLNVSVSLNKITNFF